MFFLDTNACIMKMRGHARVCLRWQQHDARELALPLIVYGELLVGAEKSNRSQRVLQQIEMLLESHVVFDVTESVAAHYARIRADLEKRGVTIGENDMWIAAMAVAHGVTLVTNNTGEFSRVPGLKIEDWTQP